jgi:hypothetical protein
MGSDDMYAWLPREKSIARLSRALASGKHKDTWKLPKTICNELDIQFLEIRAAFNKLLV